MGIIQKGILGSVSGSVGPVVFCTLNGQEVAKSKPTKSKKAPTLNQLAQTAKFGMTTAFLAHFSDLIVVGFKPVNKKSTGMNAAVSKMVTENITGIYPDLEIDYANVTLSNGRLEGSQNLVVTPKAGREVELSWDPFADADPLVVTARNKDKVYATFYDPTSERNIVVKGLSKRGDGEISVTIPRMMNGTTVHGWLSFISEDGKQASSSEYLGAIVPLV